MRETTQTNIDALEYMKQQQTNKNMTKMYKKKIYDNYVMTYEMSINIVHILPAKGMFILHKIVPSSTNLFI